MATGYTFAGPVTGGQQPYVYYSGGATPPYDVVVSLDQVFVTPPSTLPPAEGPFTIALSSAPFAYAITASKSAIWNFAANQFDPDGRFRTAVRAGFDQLLVDLDGLGLQPGRLDAIRGWIAQSIPQTFAESLYFRHGFDPARRCVELTPGMRVRVDFEEHQDVDPGNDLRNGFVGVGAATIEMSEVAAQKGGLVLGFEPFISRLSGLSVAATNGGAGGAIDLQGAANAMPYWRLCYPEDFPTSDGTGFTGTQQNVVLIGAPNRADLESATTNYVDGKTLPNDAVTVWFRGRTTVVPEVPVFLQGARDHVPLGTTARDLLSGLAPLPRSVAKAVSQHTFTRPYNALDSPWVPISYNDVPLGSQAPWSSTLDTFDLPMLGGDSLWVSVPSPT
jgi:hypothetical protein